MLMLKGLLFLSIDFSITAISLLVPAGLVAGGTWFWPRALIFLGVAYAMMVTSIILLATKAPASLEARLKAPLIAPGQPTADRVITVLWRLLALVWHAFIAVDVFFLKLFPSPPFAASVGGEVLVLFGFAIVVVALYQNAFAAPIVLDQRDRGHVVVDRGLYAHIRHPLYLGLLCLYVGQALWLGSYAALIATLIFVVMIAARTTVEEKTLLKTLPGYAEYMEKVRYRLIPFVV